ncbi:MAG: phosphoribosylglycinamide formyltransferase [Wenzhouxiangellaceae bacterium]|nr:phosphoribosylglycinamide formyltransferase [Wenzhouxiangellaceae bacterium]
MIPSDGLVLLISGRGSNALAILEACRNRTVPATVQAVVADRPAAGVDAMAEHGVDTVMLPYRRFPERTTFERDLAEIVDGYAPRLIALAGFMRVLSRSFVERYAGRLVNIHPSLLPQHRGLDTHARALAAGDREHGASVHWVTPSLDAGPVIAQARLAVAPDDTPERLAARVLEQEHRLYPAALALLLREAVELPDEDSDPPPVLLLDRDLDVRGERLGRAVEH